MRIILAALSLLLLTTFAPVGLFAPPPVPASPTLTFTPFDSGVPEVAEAWVVESDDPRFGGISALHVAGGEMLALSDTGWTFRFPSPRESQVPLQAAFLEEGPGLATRKRDRDTEALAIADSSLWITFENRNAVWRYRLSDWKAEAGAAPSAMAGWPRKQGAEAMLRLPDGRFLLLSEGLIAADATSEVLLFDRDPTLDGAKRLRLRYRPPAGFKITDAALLSDGRIAFLNRSFSFPLSFAGKLTVGRLPELKEGAVITAEEVADFSSGLVAENLEALGVTQENGRDTIWVASDNNFSPRQRTLLLKVRLPF